MSDYTITPLEQVERFTKLAEVIEANEDRFDMHHWIRLSGDDIERIGAWEASISHLCYILEVDLLSEQTPCGTVACLAGWTLSLFGHELPVEITQDAAVQDKTTRCANIQAAAEKLLGLNPNDADLLFYQDAPHQEASQAAEVLRAMVDVVVSGETLDRDTIDSIIRRD